MAYYSLNVLLDFIYAQGYLSPEHLLSLGNVFSVSNFLKLRLPVGGSCLLLSCSEEGAQGVLGARVQWHHHAG